MFIPIISDVQAPLHDRRAVGAVATMLADRGLDSVCVGDVSDQTEISRWSKGKPGEYVRTLGQGRDAAVQALKDLRVRHLSRSNHDDRLEKYVRQYGPGLMDLPELRLESFLRLDDLGIVFHRKPYALAGNAANWLLVHGDEGSLSQQSGQTALKLANKFARSVVCGHSHRLGLVHQHGSYNGRIVAPLWGLEVGHLMDMEKAPYLGGGAGNWQQGIGMLVVEGSTVFPMPLPIVKGQLYFDGKVYKDKM